jgi:hypothetical protein
MSKHRYILTIDMFIHEDSDDLAIMRADLIKQKIEAMEQTSDVKDKELSRIGFGELKETVIYSKIKTQ